MWQPLLLVFIFSLMNKDLIGVGAFRPRAWHISLRGRHLRNTSSYWASPGSSPLDTPGSKVDPWSTCLTSGYRVVHPVQLAHHILGHAERHRPCKGY